MNPLAKVGLFAVTAVAELGGCYLVFLWTRGGRSLALLGAAAVALGVFAWLLSFHPTAGRAYAAYGGVYVAMAVVWGWLVERISLGPHWLGRRAARNGHHRVWTALTQLAEESVLPSNVPAAK